MHLNQHWWWAFSVAHEAFWMRCRTCCQRIFLQKADRDLGDWNDSYDPPGGFFFLGCGAIAVMICGCAMLLLDDYRLIGAFIIAGASLVAAACFWTVRGSIRDQLNSKASVCPSCGTVNRIWPWSF